jgi:FMN reductase
MMLLEVVWYMVSVWRGDSLARASDVDQPSAVVWCLLAIAGLNSTYTGLLKSFFDRYTTNALNGAVAVPVMTGAASIHALAVEVHLRPLLIELGASTPTRGLYVTEPQFDASTRLLADGLTRPFHSSHVQSAYRNVFDPPSRCNAVASLRR